MFFVNAEKEHQHFTNAHITSFWVKPCHIFITDQDFHNCFFYRQSAAMQTQTNKRTASVPGHLINSRCQVKLSTVMLLRAESGWTVSSKSYHPSVHSPVDREKEVRWGWRQKERVKERQLREFWWMERKKGRWERETSWDGAETEFEVWKRLMDTEKECLKGKEIRNWSPWGRVEINKSALWA